MYSIKNYVIARMEIVNSKRRGIIGIRESITFYVSVLFRRFRCLLPSPSTLLEHGHDHVFERRNADRVDERIDAAVGLPDTPGQPGEDESRGGDETDLPLDGNVPLPLDDVRHVRHDHACHHGRGHPLDTPVPLATGATPAVAVDVREVRDADVHGDDDDEG